MHVIVVIIESDFAIFEISFTHLIYLIRKNHVVPNGNQICNKTKLISKRNQKHIRKVINEISALLIVVNHQSETLV